MRLLGIRPLQRWQSQLFRVVPRTDLRGLRSCPNPPHQFQPFGDHNERRMKVPSPYAVFYVSELHAPLIFFTQTARCADQIRCSTGGAGTKRHARRGPAMTLR
ncbi:hypothetical protein SAMN05444421_1042 [Celeribacter marinus]|nr:hypothetical protein SAMN05444421_1042 [Celeribacter marinus]